MTENITTPIIAGLESAGFKKVVLNSVLRFSRGRGDGSAAYRTYGYGQRVLYSEQANALVGVDRYGDTYWYYGGERDISEKFAHKATRSFSTSMQVPTKRGEVTNIHVEWLPMDISKEQGKEWALRAGLLWSTTSPISEDIATCEVIVSEYELKEETQWRGGHYVPKQRDAITIASTEGEYALAFSDLNVDLKRTSLRGYWTRTAVIRSV